MSFEPSRPDLVLGVAGTGAMGRGIAQIAAVAGIETRLFDAREGAVEESKDFITRMLRRAAEKGRMEDSAVDDALTRLKPVEKLGDFAKCHVVVEAVVEDLDVKQQLFCDLERVVSADAVLATNTSSLSVTRIAAACSHPERVAGFHFFNPVPLMKVVEVVPGARTAPQVVDALAGLATRMGHRPVRASDTPGFLVNHAGRGFGLEALRIHAEGVADVADIDRVMREAAGFPMGPFELMDLTGLDVSHAVMQSIYRQFNDEPRFRPVVATAQRVAAGLLGRKTGEGFYQYRDGTRIEPEEPQAPNVLPEKVWVGGSDLEETGKLIAFIERLPDGIKLATRGRPAPEAVCLVATLAKDATACAVELDLDPTRTMAVDTLLGLDRRLTLMATPLTSPGSRVAAHGLLARSGLPVTVIGDSPGFIAQRILAAIVNIGCDIAQQGIARADDIDIAVRLGLGYPKGPLALGDALGSYRVLTILERLLETTGDPRWRPSLWLRRRALLGVSLTTPDFAG